MPITKKSKPGKGIPRKAANPRRKAKYAGYKARSTCWCGSVFRSPGKKEAHQAEAKH